MKLKNNIFFKIGVIIFLILILMIPAAMVKGLVHERENIQEQAIFEVSSKWSEGQTITGPYLTVPFDKYIKQYSKSDSTYKTVKTREYLHVLPNELKFVGSINPEKRYRGIYEVVVYESNFKIEGNFKDLNLESYDILPSDLRLEKATINIGITDLKGIEKQIQLNWNGVNSAFNSGTTTKDLTSSGINTGVALSSNEGKSYEFNLNLDLKGSQFINFIPLGKTTDIELKSNWPTPSFSGNYLPDSKSVSDSGFISKWNILHLNRNYPQSWIGNAHRVYNSQFGTDLLLPVDNYKKSDRVAKYAILFLAFTFMVFFFVEVLNKVFIHPIQYLLVGVALIVFYSLLLSFSEHIPFNAAYGLSSSLTLLLISGYVYAILKSKKITSLISGILLILYSFIFTIIQLENYALLIGSLGVFVILCVVMYFSRKIDWYNIKLGNEVNQK
jgi:inner membrane protein